MSEAAIEHYVTEYARTGTTSDWLTPRRQSAIKALGINGFPGLKHEDWKYTDIRPVTKIAFTSAANAAGIERDYIDTISFAGNDGPELVFINGYYNAALSSLPRLPKGVIIESMAEALTKHRELLEGRLTTNADVNKNGFIALNTAFIAQGAFIYLPENSRLEQPINLLFLSSAQPQPYVSHLRNLIVAADNAEATVVESYIGMDDAEYFNNTITEIVTGNGARLQHYKLQQEGPRGSHIGTTSINQRRDSRLESHAFSLGGALIRNDIDTVLAEEGASVLMNGLYMANGRQHVDNHTRVDHAKPHTSSSENYRGVLDGHARGVFNGRVIVHKQAQKTEAHQSNANLLLSDDAEVDTKPELEIYADDVKCSHGASIGQLDENMLFYLRSRAMDEQTARSLLTFAFADEVIKNIGFAPIRERLETVVVGRLPDADLIREFVQ